MRSKNTARVDVVKKEDKEARLIEFIRTTLQAHAAASGTSHEFTLLVRSAQSPAALAVATMAGEFAAAGAGLRLLVTNTTLGATTPIPPALIDSRVLREARVLRDIRLLDAHEQLVLGTETAWIGDCMRREPGKLDAFERYSPATAAVAAWASVSFERLWAQGEMVPCAGLAAAEPVAEPAADLCAAALASGEPGHVSEAATRH